MALERQVLLSNMYEDNFQHSLCFQICSSTSSRTRYVGVLNFGVLNSEAMVVEMRRWRWLHLSKGRVGSGSFASEMIVTKIVLSSSSAGEWVAGISLDLLCNLLSLAQERSFKKQQECSERRCPNYGTSLLWKQVPSATLLVAVASQCCLHVQKGQLWLPRDWRHSVDSNLPGNYNVISQ